MNRFKAILVILLFTTLLFSNIKDVLKIGSDEDNYIFFTISDVEVDTKGNIYVSDSKQSQIIKYDKKGKFLKRIGKFGQGPGDFGKLVLALRFYNGFLYVYDSANMRIDVIDEDLNIIKYIKLKDKSFYLDFFVIDNKFIGSIFIPSDDKNRIYVYDSRGVKLSSFFKVFPEYFNVDVNKKNKYKKAVSAVYSYLLMDYSVIDKEYVITFNSPNDKIFLYFFDLNGKFKKRFEFKIKEGYKFPEFLLNFPLKYPKKYYFLSVDSMFFYKKNHILLNYKYFVVENKKYDMIESSLLMINKNTGEIVKRIKLKKGIRLLKVKNDFLYCKDFEEEIERLHIAEIKE